MSMDEIDAKLLEEARRQREAVSEFKQRAKMHIYYILIFVLSMVAMFILPFFQSTISGEFIFPDTWWGWVMFITPKVLTSILNIMIFYSFMQQAKLNVRGEEHFVKANEILGKIKSSTYVPQSPTKWQRAQYTKKGATLFLTTAVTLFTIGEMILTFNWTTFISHIVTIISGIVFGFMQMMTAEDYWTGEYYDYAIRVQDALEKEKEADSQ